MMKFFRKYTKTLLAVFMALLLMVWLGGEALRSIFQRDRDYGKVVVFQAYGQPVRANDLARITNEGEIGQRLVRFWNYPWFSILARTVNDPQLFQRLQYQGREPLSNEEWFLLDLEARRNGVEVSQEEVNQAKAGMSAEMLNRFKEQQKISIRQIDQALQSYLRVEEAALRAANAVTISEADIREFVRDTAEKVKVKMVVVDPQKLIDSNWQPSPDELNAQFEKYKNEPAGRGPDQFGYQMPEATQVEFIEISADALAKKQTVSDDEAYNYWLAHKAEFRKPASQPASTMPATRPEQPKPYDTFTEAKYEVVRKLAHDKAGQDANRLAEDLVRQLSRPWASQPTTQPGGYKEPPASEKAGDLYEKLIATLQSKYPGVLSYGRTQLSAARDLSANPKIGQAQAFAGANQPVPFQEAAFLVAGLKPEKGKDPGTSRLYRNIYETSAEPVTDQAGNVYVFRNLAARPAQAPASLDEVREKLVADLRLIRAQEQAEKIAKDLADRAKKSDLKAAFQSDAELAKKLENSALVEPEAFSRKNLYPNPRGGMPQVYGGFIPGVGYDPQLVDAAFELAGQVTTTQPSPVVTHKDNRNRWIVVEYEKTIPVTKEEYNKERELAQNYLSTQQRVGFVLDWFSSESIHARTNYKPAHEETAPPAEKAAKAKAS